MEKKKKSMILARISALCWEEIIDWSLKTALPLPLEKTLQERPPPHTHTEEQREGIEGIS